MKHQKKIKLVLNKSKVSNLNLLNIKGGQTINCLTESCVENCFGDGTGDGTEWTSFEDETTNEVQTDNC